MSCISIYLKQYKGIYILYFTVHFLSHSRLRPFVIELARIIEKYKLQGYADSVDLQFSTSKVEIGEQLQVELEGVLEHDSIAIETIAPEQSSVRRITNAEAETDRSYPNIYGVVTDTVSLLPYVGLWDISNYNGVNRVIGPDGRML